MKGHVHPWAHFAAHSNCVNVTRFRLLFVCHVQKVRELCLRANVMRTARVMMKSFAFHVRSFHSSILWKQEWLPQCRTPLGFRLGLAEPKKHKTWVWAGRKAGVGAMRDYWSDLPLDVWALKQGPLIVPLWLLMGYYWWVAVGWIMSLRGMDGGVIVRLCVYVWGLWTCIWWCCGFFLVIRIV